MKKKIVSVLTAFCLMLTMLYLPSDLFDVPGRVAAAAGHSKHSVCVGTTCTDPDHANHKEIDWRSWTNKSMLPQNVGSYYLENDVEVTKTTEITKDLTLCLNGNTITMKSTCIPMFTISPGVTLTICDCSGGNGKLTGAGGNRGDYTLLKVNGTLNLYSGTITGNEYDWAPVFLDKSGACFNMYGGSISGNHTVSSVSGHGGGAVSVNGKDCTFNMYGGSISNNTVELYGGGIYSSGTVNIYGGTISENTSDKSGGGIYMSGGTLLLEKGEITNNHGDSGVVIDNKGTFTMSGGKISGNDTTGINGGVRLNENCKFIMSGGEITDNRVCGVVVNGEGATLTLNELVNISNNGGNYHTPSDVWIYNGEGRIKIGENFQTNSVIKIETDVGRCYTPHIFAENVTTDLSDWFAPAKKRHYISYEDETDTLTEHIPHTFKTDFKYDADYHWHECGDYSRCKVESEHEKHSFTTNVTAEATCTTEGSQTLTCECGYSKTETIPVKEHTLTHTAAKASTCTAAGNIEYWYCTVCKTYFTNSACTTTTTQAKTVIAKKAHTQVTIPAVAATCTETGLTAGKKCSVCGEVITAQKTTPATGHTWSGTYTHNASNHWQVCTKCDTAGTKSAHNWNSGEVITAATEYATGEMLRTCTVCGETKTEVIPKLPHTHKWSTEWSSNGIYHYHVCTECDAHDSDTAHAWAAGAVISQPTCTDTGSQNYACSVCGAGKTETIAAKGHTEEIIPAVPATCTETGLTAGKKCSICGTILIEQTTADALGHDWNAGEVTTAPTCTEKGGKTFKCTRCNAEKTEEIPANGHTEVIIPAVPAACTTTGLTEGKKCSVCNAALVEQTIVAALGHSWNEGVVTVHPTETAMGTKIFTCTVCGVTKTEQIPMGKITTRSQTGESAPATDIKTPPEELIKAALTPEEQNIINDGTDINIILMVDDASKTVPEQDKQEVETEISTLPDCKLGQYLDIKLLKIIGSTETPIVQTNSKITVTFEIPAKLLGKKEYSVIRVHGGVTTVLKDQDNNPNTITIETDKFSTYALVYVETASASGGGRPSGGGSHHVPSGRPSGSKPTESGTPETSGSQPTESGTPETGGSQPTESGTPETGDSQPTESGTPETSASQPTESGGVSSDNTTASPVDEASSPEESTTSESPANPATGMAISFIPMLMALAAVTAAAKRKKK